METLASYDFKDKFIASVDENFKNLKERTETADNFAILSSMSNLAERAKVRLINEIVAEEETRKRDEEKTPKNNPSAGNKETKEGTKPTIPTAVSSKPKVVIKTKNISMRELVKGQKIIRTEEDINEVLESLKLKLKEELDRDTIINLI